LIKAGEERLRGKIDELANASSRGPRVYFEEIGVGLTGTRRLSLDPIEGGAVAIRTLLPIAELSEALIAALYRSKST
jgi:hypothetical protein